MVRTAALTFGAQGGLAGTLVCLNEMLRRYQAQLDSAYDFRPLVLPVGGGQTLMRPPIVSAAQMAFALGEGGQVARETSCIYQITREAQLSSAPPNWRTYLVRVWATPHRPSDGALPRTKQEVAFWNKWVAEGWAQGEKQAVEIFLSDLGRLERDIVGMARYRVLLRAGLVEPPKVAFENRPVDGGRDSLHVGDQTIRITDQPGLQGNPRSLDVRARGARNERRASRPGRCAAGARWGLCAPSCAGSKPACRTISRRCVRRSRVPRALARAAEDIRRRFPKAGSDAR